MVRARTPEVKWLYQPLAYRLLVMETLVDASIGRFEFDCFGHTRSKLFKEPGSIDEPTR